VVGGRLTVAVVVVLAAVVDVSGGTMAGTKLVDGVGSIVFTTVVDDVVDDPGDVGAGTCVVELGGVFRALESAAGEFCSITIVVSTAVVSPGFVIHQIVPPRTVKLIALMTAMLDRVHPTALLLVLEPWCFTAASRSSLA
jgi:hypothetical protein